MVAGVLTPVFVGVALDVRARVYKAVTEKLEAGQRILSALEERHARELSAQVATLAENPTLKVHRRPHDPCVHAGLHGRSPRTKEQRHRRCYRRLSALSRDHHQGWLPGLARLHPHRLGPRGSHIAGLRETLFLGDSCEQRAAGRRPEWHHFCLRMSVRRPACGPRLSHRATLSAENTSASGRDFQREGISMARARITEPLIQVLSLCADQSSARRIQCVRPRGIH
jgi:hypothetical protein